MDTAIEKSLESMGDWQEDLYEDVHRHPELSMQEEGTAGRIEHELAQLGLGTRRFGGTGVVAVIENGEGPTVLARADIDALPVTEDRIVDYRSETDGVMHACGHDFHLSALLGAVRALVENREGWSGTYIAVFQPGEEEADGALSMLRDGLAEAVPRPDVALGQHVMPGIAGQVAITDGPVLSQGDSVHITLHGRGAHGSMPHLAVDPVVLASSIVLRLQQIVSREIPPGSFSVVTVGALNAGTKSNVIPATAELRLNLRHYDTDVRDQVIAALERIVRAECEASGCPQEPEFEYYDQYPLTSNDAEQEQLVRAAFEEAFDDGQVVTMAPATASEDFSHLPDAFGAPYVYWTVGGTDPDLYRRAQAAGTIASDVPANHQSAFVPQLRPTLAVMTRAQVVAALAYLDGTVSDHPGSGTPEQSSSDTSDSAADSSPRD
ncbi:amidohydrolase [Brachybacterium sp. ACRRE]|uniref:amidohydrolase n=1 Tax=Brachybacterium sp. ACRRE TaxID=2918184 RepID=UPI001EF16D8E|nr:amidohydrolase [Brachybacterium sp. ACRRE]MCG7310627.1 amidohydrolase [Brachybacterium sp. ACRRE]